MGKLKFYFVLVSQIMLLGVLIFLYILLKFKCQKIIVNYPYPMTPTDFENVLYPFTEICLIILFATTLVKFFISTVFPKKMSTTLIERLFLLVEIALLVTNIVFLLKFWEKDPIKRIQQDMLVVSEDEIKSWLLFVQKIFNCCGIKRHTRTSEFPMSTNESLVFEQFMDKNINGSSTSTQRNFQPSSEEMDVYALFKIEDPQCDEFNLKECGPKISQTYKKCQNYFLIATIVSLVVSFSVQILIETVSFRNDRTNQGNNNNNERHRSRSRYENHRGRSRSHEQDEELPKRPSTGELTTPSSSGSGSSRSDFDEYSDQYPYPNQYQYQNDELDSPASGYYRNRSSEIYESPGGSGSGHSSPMIVSRGTSRGTSRGRNRSRGRSRNKRIRPHHRHMDSDYY